MALVDVGVRGLEFEVPDDWNESQVRDMTRTRYPFLFPDLVEASRNPPPAPEPVPGPIEIPATALAPVEVLPPPAPLLPPPVDAAEAAYRDKFGVRSPTTTGTPSFGEALLKEYLGTVSSAVPSVGESIRLLDAAFGSQALADLAGAGLPALAPSRAATRVEAARNLDPMFEELRRLRAAGESAYDYNRNALPAWQQKLAEWLGSGLGSMTAFLPSVLAGPAGPLGLGIGMSFSPAYEEARRSGASPEAALTQALIESGLEAGSEYFFGGAGRLTRMLSRKPPKNAGTEAKKAFEEALRVAGEPLVKTIAKAVGIEGAEEFISGAFKDISAAYFTKTDKSRGLTGTTKDPITGVETPNWLRYVGRRLDDFMGGAAGGAGFVPAIRSAQAQAPAALNPSPAPPNARLADRRGTPDPVPSAGTAGAPPRIPSLATDRIRTAPRVRARALGVFRTALDDAARRRDQDGLVAVGLMMRESGYTDDEIHGYIDASVARFWERPSPDTTIRVRIPRSGETLSEGRNKPATEEARTIEGRPGEQLDEARMRAEDAARMGAARVAARGKITAYTVDRVRKALGVPDDVEIVVNTTDVGASTGADGRTYTRPGLWADGKITIWARNIRSEEHLRRVLAEENNHRILGTPEGQRALKRFLAEVPVADMVAGAAPWLQSELAKYEGRPDLEITDEFVAKLGSDPTWKRVLGEWYAMLRNKLGMRLSDTSAARLLLRQVREGKVSVAPVVAAVEAPPEPAPVPAEPAPAPPPTPAAKPMRAVKRAAAPPEPAPAPAEPPVPEAPAAPAPEPAPAPTPAKPMRAVRVPTAAEAPEPAPAPAVPEPAAPAPGASPAPDETPDDLREAIANERRGAGPLTPEERVELNELEITRREKGRLGVLNQARLDHLEARARAAEAEAPASAPAPVAPEPAPAPKAKKKRAPKPETKPAPESAPAPAPTAPPATPAVDPGPAIRALNAAIRTGGIVEVAGAKVTLDKFPPEVLAAVADRFGIPREGPDLPGRIIAHTRIGVNYRIGPGETSISAATRVATLNTEAALTRDVKVIGGKTGGTKLDKAKQLVKRAQEIEVVKEKARNEAGPAYRPAAAPAVLAPAEASEGKALTGKDAKKELVRRLEAALEAAPAERGAGGAPSDITITVGGGTYTMVNTKAVVGEALRKAKALDTSTAPVARVEGGDTFPGTGEPAWRRPAKPIGGIDPESWANSSEPTHRVSTGSGAEWVRVPGKEVEIPGMPAGYRTWVVVDDRWGRGGKRTPVFRVIEETTGTEFAEDTGKLQDVVDAAAAKIEELGPDKVVEALRDRKAMVATNPPPAPEKIERSNLDAEYLAAVEAGDMATAQRMVDEAAKRAGYTVGPVWHGTDEPRNVFDGGAYFTDSKGDASAYAELRALKKAVDENDELNEIVSEILAEEGADEITDLGPKTIRDIADANKIELSSPDGFVLRAHLAPGRLLDLSDLGSEVGSVKAAWNALHAKGFVGQSWDDLGDEGQDEVRGNYRGMAMYRMLEGEDVLSTAFKQGYDTVLFVDQAPEGKSVHKSWLTKSNTQFKSAEPVTRDDAGNVIPLSQRFNPASPDIRESLGDALPPAPGNVTSPYEQVRAGGNEAVGGADPGATPGGVPQVGGVAGVPAVDPVQPGQQPAQARRDAARRLAGIGHPAWKNDRDLARELGVPVLDKEDPYFTQHFEFPKRGVESVIFDASDTRGVLIKATDPFAAVGISEGPAHAILREYISQNDPAFVPTTIKGVSDMRSAVRIVMEQPFLELYRQPASIPDEARGEVLRKLGLFPTSKYGVSAISYATGEFFRIQDLNKGNVLFDPTGAPHIVDFVADPITDELAGYAIADALQNGSAKITDIPPGPALRALRAAQADGQRDPNLAATVAAFEAQQRSSLGDELVTTTIDGTTRQMPARLAQKRAQGLEYTLRKLADCLVKR